VLADFFYCMWITPANMVENIFSHLAAGLLKT
jgi:hypothetical protein